MNSIIGTAPYYPGIAVLRGPVESIPSQTCVDDLISAQAKARPDAIAVVAGNGSFTYAELEARATRVAHLLQSVGVGPDVLVAVFVERSLELAVALLGVLKAGGAYIPLDESYPHERLEFMLSDAQPLVLLTQKSFLPKLPETRAKVVLLDGEIGPADSRPCEKESTPENLAYVLYTSGSTGKPKGVQIRHRSLMNLLKSGRQELGLNSDDIFVALSTISFDIATAEIFLPLITGARLVIARSAAIRDGRLLMGLLQRTHATVMEATPALWQLLVDSGWMGSPDLKILAAGEALRPELATNLLRRGREVWNLYGPTETTIWSSGYRVTGNEKGSVPIGRPLANTEIYILDKDLEPVSSGVVGEIYIAGEGLARGYLGQPELTAAKFVPNPFSRGLMYRTGDLARLLPDGTIDHLGRMDNQVKVRGFRIEPAEIEIALLQHEAVKDAIVVAAEHMKGDKRLVACLILCENMPATAESIRAFLRPKLPEYMIPSQIVFLESFPLTPNGKVDRQALLAEEINGSPAREFVSARNGIESTLVRIWEDVLGVHPIGVTDDIIDLGAHSLFLANIANRIEQTFSKTISISTLFEASTVEKLAILLQGEVPTVSRLIPIQPLGSRPPFFCLGGGPLFRPLALRLGADQPFLALMPLLESEAEALTPPYRLEDIASQLVHVIMNYWPEGPYSLGGWSDAGIVAYETARQLIARGCEVSLLALFDVENPAFQQNAGPGTDPAKIKLLADQLKQLKARELPGYFREKLQEARRRAMNSSARIENAIRARVGGGGLKDPHQILSVAVSSYRPQPYSGRVAFFKAATRSVGQAWNLDDGWREAVNGELHVFEIPGDHRSIFAEPNVRHIAEEMNQYLAAAQTTLKAGRI